MVYTVSMDVDARVDVKVDADSFDEAFAKAVRSTIHAEDMEVVGFYPVNATDADGVMEDYNG